MNKLFIEALKTLLPSVNFSKSITDPGTMFELEEHVNSLNSLFPRSIPFLSKIECYNTFLMGPLLHPYLTSNYFIF